VYLSVGFLLLHAAVLPRAFAWLAVTLGAAFAVAGLIGTLLPAVAATAGLAGLQVVWLVAAALALRAGPVPAVTASTGGRPPGDAAAQMRGPGRSGARDAPPWQLPSCPCMAWSGTWPRWSVPGSGNLLCRCRYESSRRRTPYRATVHLPAHRAGR
jgi:hypothetical protein